MQGTFKSWKLGSYEAKKLGKAETARLSFGLTKLHNFSTSQLPSLYELVPKKTSSSPMTIARKPTILRFVSEVSSSFR